MSALTIERVAEVEILASPHRVFFAPGGKGLLCAGSGLWICDLAGKVTHTFRKPSGYGVTAFVTPKAVIGKSSSVIRRWNPKTRALEAELEPDALGYHVLTAVSSDGKRVLTTTRNKSFTVWDLESGAALASATEKKSFVVSASLSPDGKRVAYGGTDGIVRFFDVAANEPAGRANGKGWIEIIARSDDGRFFASGGRAGVVSIWTRDGKLHRAVTQGAKISALTFSPKAELLVAYASHGAPIVWDVATGKRLATIDDHEPKGLLGGTRSVEFSSDGKRIVTMGNDCRAVVSKLLRR